MRSAFQTGNQTQNNEQSNQTWTCSNSSCHHMTLSFIDFLL
jgi:hypothetical protein